MDYVIIVNDNGELKTISATEIDKHGRSTGTDLEAVIETVLDLRSAVVESLLKRADQVFGYDEANETVDAKTRS